MDGLAILTSQSDTSLVLAPPPLPHFLHLAALPSYFSYKIQKDTHALRVFFPSKEERKEIELVVYI